MQRSARWMERACRAVQWPIVLRAATLGERGGYDRSELARYTRSGVRDAVALLGAGRVVVVFPEGYPNVDPAFARKSGDDAFLAVRTRLRADYCVGATRSGRARGCRAVGV